jgi:hypothetical protein
MFLHCAPACVFEEHCTLLQFGSQFAGEFFSQPLSETRPTRAKVAIKKAFFILLSNLHQKLYVEQKNIHTPQNSQSYKNIKHHISII